MNVRLEDSELLKDWGETVRTNRAIPARRAKDNPEWADVLALLPVPVLKQERGLNNGRASPILPKKTSYVPLKDRATYGNPTHFSGNFPRPRASCKRLPCHCLLAAQLGRLPSRHWGGGALKR